MSKPTAIVSQQPVSMRRELRGDMALPSIQACFRNLEQNSFDSMWRTFHRVGGLVDADDILDLLRSRSACSQPLSGLAHWLVDRSIVSFGWQSRTFVPLFQFVKCDMSVVQGVREAIAELVDVYDDWELASWFSRPNTWMQYATPADAVARDPASVLQAARADRFILRG